jgi:hypothetical protein
MDDYAISGTLRCCVQLLNGTQCPEPARWCMALYPEEESGWICDGHANRSTPAHVDPHGNAHDDGAAVDAAFDLLHDVIGNGSQRNVMDALDVVDIAFHSLRGTTPPVRTTPEDCACPRCAPSTESVLSDLIERLETAARRLDARVRVGDVAQNNRLRGKAEGVRLALSIIKEKQL